LTSDLDFLACPADKRHDDSLGLQDIFEQFQMHGFQRDTFISSQEN
jgi:hypothetical protein